MVGAIVIAALTSLCVAPDARADVPDDRRERVKAFQNDLLRVTTPSSDSYEIRRGEGTASVVVDDLSLLRQAHEVSREQEVATAWAWRATGQLLVAFLATPAGAWLAFDNFLGRPRPAGVAPYVPEPATAVASGGDLGSFALATVGLGLVSWGLSEGVTWVRERLGWSTPRFLEVKEAVDLGVRARSALLADWVLVEADVATSGSVAVGPGPLATASGQPASASAEPRSGGGLAALTTAGALVRAQRSDGYRPVVVYARALPDASGVLARGEWHVGWQHRDRPDWLDVTVPVFGESPRIGSLPDPSRVWGWPAGIPPREGEFAAAPAVDSPEAMKTLMEELTRRGLPVLLDEMTLLWVARHPQLGRTLWMLEAPEGVLPVAVDARSGQVVEIPQPGPGTLPTVPQAPAR